MRDVVVDETDTCTPTAPRLVGPGISSACGLDFFWAFSGRGYSPPETKQTAMVLQAGRPLLIIFATVLSGKRPLLQ
jgi:hypothetical protein